MLVLLEGSVHPRFVCDNAQEKKLLTMAQTLIPFFLPRRTTTHVSRTQLFLSIFVSSRLHACSAVITPRSKNIESAIIVLRKKLHSDALASVLHSVSDIPSSSAVFHRFSRQKDFRQTAGTYVPMILRLGLAGNNEEMDVLLKEMVKLKPLELDSSLKYLVESFCTNQCSMAALKVFEIARSANLRFPLSVCNLLLRLLVSDTGKLSLVLYIYKEMVKAEILPNVETLNCVIKALCDLGRLDSALIQFYRMKHKKCSPDSWTFELIIGGLASNGRIDEAVEILKQMLEVQCSLNHQFYSKILPLFCDPNKIDESVKLLRMMKSYGNCPDVDVYSVLIEFFSENLQIKFAVEMFDEMTESGITPKTSSHVHIMTGYCKLGNFNDALKFLRGSINSPVESYHVLLTCFCDSDRYSEAFDLLDMMQNKNICDGISWNIIINRLCKKGNVRKTFEVLCRMVVLSYLPDTVTYSSLVTGYCRNTESDRAFEIFKHKLDYEMCLELWACSDLFELLCYSKKIGEATEVFSHIASRGGSLSLSSLNILINEICYIGKVDEAIEIRLYAACNGTQSSSSTYTPILNGLLELNMERYILPVFAQMLVEGCSLDANTYCILIHGLCIMGRSKIACDFFNRMINDGVIPGSEMLQKLVEVFAKCSHMKLVVHSLERLVEVGTVLSPLVSNLVVSTLLKEGDKFAACKFLDWMFERDWVPDPYTHGLLVGNNDTEASVGTKNAGVAVIDRVGNILAEGLDGLS